MEILHFETIQPSTTVNVLLLVWGFIILGVGLDLLRIDLIHEEKPSWSFIITELVCGTIMIAINLSVILSKQPEKYIYARIDKTVPYVEMIEKYEFIETQDGIYKLKELSP